MGSPRPSWRMLRPLRPILLASAGVVAWLALSAPAAGADTGSDSHSLLGGITSSVSSATKSVSHPMQNTAGTVNHAVNAVPSQVLLPAPVSPPIVPSPPTSGVIQPVVGGLTGAGDQIISSVPVVNQVVPVEPVNSVVSPVVTLAEDAASELTETVLPPVAEALPVLYTVLPVADLVANALGESPVTDVESGRPVVMTGDLDPRGPPRPLQLTPQQ